MLNQNHISFLLPASAKKTIKFKAVDHVQITNYKNVLSKDYIQSRQEKKILTKYFHESAHWSDVTKGHCCNQQVTRTLSQQHLQKVSIV